AGPAAEAAHDGAAARGGLQLTGGREHGRSISRSSSASGAVIGAEQTPEAAPDLPHPLRRRRPADITYPVDQRLHPTNDSADRLGQGTDELYAAVPHRAHGVGHVLREPAV